MQILTIHTFIHRTTLIIHFQIPYEAVLFTNWDFKVHYTSITKELILFCLCWKLMHHFSKQSLCWHKHLCICECVPERELVKQGTFQECFLTRVIMGKVDGGPWDWGSFKELGRGHTWVSELFMIGCLIWSKKDVDSLNAPSVCEVIYQLSYFHNTNRYSIM